MNTYLVLKTLHIISSVLLVGTGLGSAFYLFFANRSGSVAAQAVVGAQVVVAVQAVVVTPVAAIHAEVIRVGAAPALAAVNRAQGRNSAPPGPVAGRSANPAARKRAGKTPGRSGKKRLLSKITAPRAPWSAKAREMLQAEHSMQVLHSPRLRPKGKPKLRIVPLYPA